MTLSASQKARLSLVRSNAGNVSSGSRALVVRTRPIRQQQQLVVAGPRATARRRQRRRLNRGSTLPQSLPANAGTSVVSRAPVYSGGAPGELVISHEEILGSVHGGSFTSFRDPMIPSQFLWLDGVAKNFSQFRWEALTAYYQTSVGTGINGEVALGWIFDFDSAPVDALEAQCLHNNVASPPWSNLCVPTSVDTNKFGKPRYAFLSRGQYERLDPNDCDTYVPCWLVTTSEASLSGVVGRVRVRYRIRLSNPIPSRMNDPTATTSVAGVTLRASVSDSNIVQDPVTRLANEVRNLMSGLSVTTTLPIIPFDPPIAVAPLVSTFSVTEKIEQEAEQAKEDGRI